MNFLSETRRRLIDQMEEARDWRSSEQKIADALAAHLVNIGLCERLGPARPEDPAAALAMLAWEDSQADLFRLVEDHCLVDPRKLGKALAHVIA